MNPDIITLGGVRYWVAPVREDEAAPEVMQRPRIVEEEERVIAALRFPAAGMPWTVRDVARARGMTERTIRDEVARRRIKPMRPTRPYTFSEQEAKRYLGIGEGGR